MSRNRKPVRRPDDAGATVTVDLFSGNGKKVLTRQMLAVRPLFFTGFRWGFKWHTVYGSRPVTDSTPGQGAWVVVQPWKITAYKIGENRLRCSPPGQIHHAETIGVHFEEENASIFPNTSPGSSTSATSGRTSMFSSWPQQRLTSSRPSAGSTRVGFPANSGPSAAQATVHFPHGGGGVQTRPWYLPAFDRTHHPKPTKQFRAKACRVVCLLRGLDLADPGNQAKAQA
eukprot:gene17196-biopygen10226